MPVQTVLQVFPLSKVATSTGVPAASVMREYKDVVFPIDEATRHDRDRGAIRNVAKRLRDLVKGSRAVPKPLAGEVLDVVDRLLESVSAKDAAEAA